MGTRTVEAILNLIIVDDDPDIRRGLAMLLRSHGHHVTVFESAEDFLARDLEVHCAILDIALPGMSGLELNDRMTASGRRMPVVFITAKVERSVLAAVQRTGHAVLKKPLVENGLLEAIAGAIRDQT